MLFLLFSMFFIVIYRALLGDKTIEKSRKYQKNLD